MNRWESFFENIIQQQLPKTTMIQKSFYPKTIAQDFGDLVRFELEIYQKIIDLVDCWSSGTVSIEVFDVDMNELLFIVLALPDEINKIKSTFNRLVNVLNTD